MCNMSQVKSGDISAMENPSFQTVIGRVAAILLRNAGNDTDRKSSLSQREMAILLETSWDQVNKSLRYLHEKGAIRIDHHRIIIKEPSLRKIAGGIFS
jgi:DNA-binding GntR family transcriptional regulator